MADGTPPAEHPRPAHSWKNPDPDEEAPPSMPGYFAMYGGLFLAVILIALVLVGLMKALR